MSSTNNKTIIYANDDYSEWTIVRCYDEDHTAAAMAARNFGGKPNGHPVKQFADQSFKVPLIGGREASVRKIQVVAPDGTLYYREGSDKARALLGKIRAHFAEIQDSVRNAIEANA